MVSESTLLRRALVCIHHQTRIVPRLTKITVMTPLWTVENVNKLKYLDESKDVMGECDW